MLLLDGVTIGLVWFEAAARDCATVTISSKTWFTLRLCTTFVGGFFVGSADAGSVRSERRGPLLQLAALALVVYVGTRQQGVARPTKTPLHGGKVSLARRLGRDAALTANGDVSASLRDSGQVERSSLDESPGWRMIFSKSLVLSAFSGMGGRVGSLHFPPWERAARLVWRR